LPKYLQLPSAGHPPHIVTGINFCYTIMYNRREQLPKSTPVNDPVPHFGRHDYVFIDVISNTVTLLIFCPGEW
jgi:hypothetical protein